MHHAVHEAAHGVVAWMKTIENNDQEGSNHQEEEPGFTRIFVRSLEDAVAAPDHRVGAVMRTNSYDPSALLEPQV
jgi:hypothetical protein